MSIKKKSIFLVITFSLLLLLNGIGIFVAMEKIKHVNEHLIKQADITKEVFELRYILKSLQEISTDIALMGDKEGLKEIEKIKEDYINQYKKISKIDFSKTTVEYLNNINSNFSIYSTALKEMAKAGIKKTEARKASLEEMKVFDKAVIDIENTIDSIYTKESLLTNLKYDIVSIQEILTDALAVGDISGFSEVDKISDSISLKIKNILIITPSLKLQLEKLSTAIKDMIDAGKTMSQKGETFTNQELKTEQTMEIVDSKHDLISKNISKIIETQEKQMSLTIQEDLDVINNAEMVFLVLTILFLIAVVSFVLIIKGILSNIQKLDIGVANLLDESKNSKVDIKTNDEIGNISNNFNLYLETLEKDLNKDKIVIEEARKVMGKVEVGLLNDTIKGTASSKEVKKLILAINEMITSTQKNITAISDSLIQLSLAKYDTEIPKLENVTGLIAAVLDGTKVVQSTSSEVLALIDNANKRLTFSAEDLSHASGELSKSSNEQAAALEETAAAIEEVTSTIDMTSENAAKMSLYASNVTKSSKAGVELATKTSTSMDELSTEVNTINEAITIIDQIAFQTNILSLNAAVEAATAGEAGKGFAVVAQEVRNLAARSAEAANEIKALVESATSKAKEGKEVSSQMIDGFNELNENITTTIELIDDVANATKEQQEAMSQINDTVNSLDRETQKNAAQAASISEMAKETKDLAVQLQAAVDKTSFPQDAKRRVCDTDIIFELNKLKTDHLNFKNTNFCACKAGETFTVKHHTQCDMGKWIIANENSEFAQTELWEELKKAHMLIHHMVQDTVDLYAEEYENGQIISVTNNLEQQVQKVFHMIDQLKEHNCDLQFQKRRA